MATADQPNVLLVMSDEHAPQYSSTYGHPIVRTPNMDRLAAAGATFENAYCNSPLCLPSRMSFMTGRFGSRVASFDNASPLPSDAVTWAHRFRAAGYDVALAGKMHYCGPDQLHGFSVNLSRDIHAELWMEDGPAFVPRGAADWVAGIDESDPNGNWHIAEQAGPGSTEEIEVDDDVEAKSLAYLSDPARKQAPWILNASFIAPHFPLIAPQEYWEAYPHDEIDIPVTAFEPLDDQPRTIQRMRCAFNLAGEAPESVIRNGRAGYYSIISWFDKKLGRLLDVLESSGQMENTIIVYVSDHGEMAGEHGMWRKSNMYEASARVPLQIAWPSAPNRIPPGIRCPGVCSTVDLVATLLDLCNIPDVSYPAGLPLPPLDGDSLATVMSTAAGGGDMTSVGWKDEAMCEYLAHGVISPNAMLRVGRYKLLYSHGDPAVLWDIEADPDEMHNLAEEPVSLSTAVQYTIGIRGAEVTNGFGVRCPQAHQETVAALQRRLFEVWGNPDEIQTTVLASQAARQVIAAAAASGTAGMRPAGPRL